MVLEAGRIGPGDLLKAALRTAARESLRATDEGE